jgi:hypothetical protein
MTSRAKPTNLKINTSESEYRPVKTDINEEKSDSVKRVSIIKKRPLAANNKNLMFSSVTNNDIKQQLSPSYKNTLGKKITSNKQFNLSIVTTGRQHCKNNKFDEF